MDKHTIREASALFAIEEVTKLLDRTEEVTKNLEAKLKLSDEYFESYSATQSVMLNKVAQKMDIKYSTENSNNEYPRMVMAVISIVSLCIGIGIGAIYIIATSNVS